MKYDYEKIFQWIVKYMTLHKGMSPTIREIGDEFDIKSTSNVSHALRELQDRGRIIIMPKSSRGIMIENSEWTYKG